MHPFFVIGTRPEIIKMAPVIHECERQNIEYFLLHTGQHYSRNMSDAIFEDLQLRAPDKNLEIGSGTHGEQTANALLGIERELLARRPDVVVVQGDTNAVLSAALAAVKLRIPVAHVEAGLRSYDKRMPEEHNRRLTDHISDFLFAPTEASARTLRREHVWGEIFVTGNTVIDALESSLPVAIKKSTILSEIGMEDFALMTLHRAENVDDRETLEGLVKGILDLQLTILFTAHPRTVSRLKEFNLLDRLTSSDRVRVIEPPSYLDFITLLKNCRFVITDSGGIQEEVTAPSINKTVFVLRKTTERPEAVRSGHAHVVGVNPELFVRRIRRVLGHLQDDARPCPYGDGHAAQRIVDTLKNKID